MTYSSVVAVLVLVSLTKKRIDHYAILKLLSLRSPSNFAKSTKFIAQHDLETKTKTFKVIDLNVKGI